MNIISKKSTLISFVLAGLVVGSVPTTAQAALSAPQKFLIAVGLGSLFLTNCKEAVANPEVVTWNDLKKLVQVQGVFTQEYWQNVVKCINNGYFGQAGIRGKAVLGMVSEEDGSMAFKTVNSLPSSGICGNVLYGLKLVGKKSGDICGVIAAFGLMYANFVNIEQGKFADVKAPGK